MKRNEGFYKWVKIGGLVSSIPFILISGPVAGYFFADYLRNRFNFNPNIIFIFIVIGLIASLNETIKIIIAIIKIEKKGQG